MRHDPLYEFFAHLQKTGESWARSLRVTILAGVLREPAVLPLGGVYAQIESVVKRLPIVYVATLPFMRHAQPSFQHEHVAEFKQDLESLVRRIEPLPENDEPYTHPAHGLPEANEPLQPFRRPLEQLVREWDTELLTFFHAASFHAARITPLTPEAYPSPHEYEPFRILARDLAFMLAEFYAYTRLTNRQHEEREKRELITDPLVSLPSAFKQILLRKAENFSQLYFSNHVNARIIRGELPAPGSVSEEEIMRLFSSPLHPKAYASWLATQYAQQGEGVLRRLFAEYALHILQAVNDERIIPSSPLSRISQLTPQKMIYQHERPLSERVEQDFQPLRKTITPTLYDFLTRLGVVLTLAAAYPPAGVVVTLIAQHGPDHQDVPRLLKQSPYEFQKPSMLRHASIHSQP